MQRLSEYDSMRPKGHPYAFDKHSYRVAENMKRLAKARNYDESMCAALYWATLPHDIGKIRLPISIWDIEDKPTDEQRMERRRHTMLGVEIMREQFGDLCDTDSFLSIVVDIMTNHHEAMDGTGFLGKKGTDLSEIARMACICDAYDGWSIQRPHFDNDRDLTPEGVLDRMRHEKCGQFDPVLLNKFEEVILKS